MEFSKYFAQVEIETANAMLALGAAILSYIGMVTALALVRRRLCKLEARKAERPIAELLKATLARTSHIAIVATALLIGLSVLTLPVPWGERVKHLWFITLGLQLAIYFDQAIGWLARRYFRKRARSADSPASVAQTLSVWALKTSLWVMFFLAMLANLGVDVTAFVASLGIGGIAVALAVQNILGDLFASLSIAVDKPFEVGDFISVAGFLGSVEHVGLKTTRVRADSGEQIVISNAELLKNTVRNYKRMTERRVPFSLRLNPRTPRELSARVPEAIRAVVEQQERVRFDRAHLRALDQNFIEYEVVYFMLTPDYVAFMDTQQKILLGIMAQFDELGVTMAPASQHFIIEGDAKGGDTPVNALLEREGPPEGRPGS